MFLDIFAHPKSSTQPVLKIGDQNQTLFSTFVSKWQAGNVKPQDLEKGLANVDKQIDAAIAQLVRCRDPRHRPRARSLPESLETAGGPKRRAAWRRRGLVLVLMSPWLVGSTVFFACTLVMSEGNLSFTHYDCCRPALGRTANYHYLFEQDQRVWPAVDTLWMMVRVRSAACSRVRAGTDAAMRARHGAGVFRAIFYLPALAPTWRRRSASSIC